jgi:SAM-dependent methyltransferase
MGKSVALRWLENRYLRRHLRGRGMEIGALWRRFPVHPKARVWYVDRSRLEDLKKQYADVGEKIFLPDLVAEATELPVARASLDFLIASHVLEHLPFPLLALRAWYQALAPGGVLLLKVPDKRYTFDVRRSRTPISRLLAEYEHPELFDWRAHYTDWVENVDGRKPTEPELDQASEGLMTGAFNIHYQVWIDEDLLEIVEFTRQEWGLDWKPLVFLKAHFYRKEAAVLLARRR